MRQFPHINIFRLIYWRLWRGHDVIADFGHHTLQMQKFAIIFIVSHIILCIICIIADFLLLLSMILEAVVNGNVAIILFSVVIIILLIVHFAKFLIIK